MSSGDETPVQRLVRRAGPVATRAALATRAASVQAARRLAAWSWDIAKRPASGAVLVVALLSWSVWSEGNEYIDEVSSTLAGIRELVSGDAEQYLAIADTMLEGDFSMSWVAPTDDADRAHRQPGFPALLAAAEALGLRGAPDLARVNLAVVVASLWIALVGAMLATGSVLAGLLAAAVVYSSRFLVDIAVERLLTEPLYVAVSLAAVAATLSYTTRAGAGALMSVAAFGGLAYVVRVNGLFLALSLALAVVLADRWRRGEAAGTSDAGDDAGPGVEDADAREQDAATHDDASTDRAGPATRHDADDDANASVNEEHPDLDYNKFDDDDEYDDEQDGRWRDLFTGTGPATAWAAYAVAVALFVAVTVPSWLPRTIHAGSPVYHGYLANYLWVDEPRRANVPGAPQYGPATYLAENGLGDVWARLSFGVKRALWEAPRDKVGEAASLAMLAAIVVLVLLRDRAGLLLLGAGLLQMLPLVWTALPNPTRRLPAAALLPFAAMLVAAATAALLRRAHERGHGTETNGGAAASEGHSTVVPLHAGASTSAGEGTGKDT